MPDAPSPLGQPLARADAVLKVTGRAKFAGETPADRIAHAVIVTSTIARGRVRAYDTAEAEKLPGVLAVFTPKTVPPLRPIPDDIVTKSKHPPTERRTPLADDLIHHVGQAVAFVVAETFEQAADAASRVRLTYQAENPVLSLEKGTDPFRPEKFGDRDGDLQSRRGDPVKALADAPVKVEAEYRTPVHHHNPIEPCTAVAEWDGDRLTLHDSSRNLHGMRKAIAAAFGLPEQSVRIISPFVGGAFGAKGFTFQHNLLAAVAARHLKRPVRLALTRAQMFTLAGRRPETRQTVSLGATKEGRLTAIRHITTNETSPLNDFVEPCGTLSAQLYACPNVELVHEVKRINRSSPVFMRGPGEAPGMFAFESALDELATACGLDPLEFRLRNHGAIDESNGLPWSTDHAKDCLRVGAERFGWAKRDPKPGSMRDGRLLVGWGMATAAYPAFRSKASAKVKVLADGRAVASSAAHEIGTGAQTVFAQVAADALGLPIDKVRFELGDSALPFAPGAGASRSTASIGAAVVEACRNLLGKVAKLAGAEGRGEQFFIDALKKAGLKSLDAEAETAPGEEKQKFSFMSFGAYFFEVQIDLDMPRVRVTRVVGVFDPGRVLNPRTARSQLVGGIVMGIGATLTEATHYDPRTGTPMNRDLGEYHLATCADVPEIDVTFLGEPDMKFNPTGGRGIGELGITGSTAAIANAVFHATGKRIRETPITPDKLL